MKDLTDFAVIARSASTELSNLGKAVLRVVPLENAPTLTAALGGLSSGAYNADQNMTLEADSSISKSNIHSVQDRSNGYVRVVARINGSTLPEGVTSPEGYPPLLKTAFGFALLKETVEGVGENATVTGWEVLAVASLKEGCNLTDGCYVAFTFSKTNNYQSVSFSPNAFATIEDLDKINGLDGLHIAFDTASGDLKLLDKDGNVLDQANLPIKTDVIIAEGEEGYKYVKTDVEQDIHAAKAWMPKGSTAWKAVPSVGYTMQKAALVVEQIYTPDSRVFKDSQSDYSSPVSTEPVSFNHVLIDDSIYMVVDRTDTNCKLVKVTGEAGELEISNAGILNEEVKLNDSTQSYTINSEAVEVDVVKAGETTHVLVGTESPGEFRVMPTDGTPRVLYTGTIETSGGSSTSKVLGIALVEQEGKKMYTLGEGVETTITSISKKSVKWFCKKDIPAGTSLKYGLEAFVWTVKDAKAGDKIISPFFKQLNASLLALGFHEGDDIALGTNLATLVPTEGDSPLNKVDADYYMHGETKNESGKTNKELREQEVDAQRANAKEELVAWNAQHPGLDHDGLKGTRISSDGVDIRNGKIEIGNGVEHKGEDNVKRYVLETDIDGDGARSDKGLQIGVIDEFGGIQGAEPIQKDILTINAEDYISGAPTCLALLKCSKSGNPATVSANLDGGRITANFTASGAEDNGVFTLTITDNRANNGFGKAPRIVEIIPVYKSDADASEAVPAQRSISAIKEPNKEPGGKTLSIQCSQVIDWAQSIDLGGTEHGMELYLIVKVY